MNASTQQSRRSEVWRSPWVRLFAGLISATTAYLQFRQAGLTVLFWMLCGLTVTAVLLTTVQLALKWLRQRRWRREMARLRYDHQQKMQTLAQLADTFVTLEKAKRLADTMTDDIRVVAILPVEGEVGVMLNVGTEEDVQVGTQLVVHRIDRYTSAGQQIEEPLALVRVTYVQAENNCSQGVVVARLDAEFWDQVAAQLGRQKKIEPPRNFAVPYIPEELRGLSLEDLAVFRGYLQIIHDSLIRIGLDEMVQDEMVQEETVQ